jgi:hypothetical protein
MADTNPFDDPNFGADPAAARNPFDDPEFGKEPTLKGEAVKGFKRGVDSTQQGLYGLAALAGDVTGLKMVEDFGREGVARNQREAAENPAAVRQVQDVGGVRDAALWAAGGLGELVPFVASSALGAGVGGVALKGVTTAAKAATAGAGLTSIAQETGSITADQIGDGKGEIDAAKAAGYGIAAGALDLIPEARIIRKLTKADAPNIGVTRDLVTQAGLEAATEGGQTALERMGAGKEAFDEEGRSEMLNAAALGALGGGVIGGAGRALQGAFAPPAEVPPAPAAEQPPAPLALPAPGTIPIPGAEGEFRTPEQVQAELDAVRNWTEVTQARAAEEARLAALQPQPQPEQPEQPQPVLAGLLPAPGDSSRDRQIPGDAGIDPFTQSHVQQNAADNASAVASARAKEEQRLARFAAQGPISAAAATAMGNGLAGTQDALRRGGIEEASATGDSSFALPEPRDEKEKATQQKLDFHLAASPAMSLEFAQAAARAAKGQVVVPHPKGGFTVAPAKMLSPLQREAVYPFQKQADAAPAATAPQMPLKDVAAAKRVAEERTRATGREFEAVPHPTKRDAFTVAEKKSELVQESPVSTDSGQAQNLNTSAQPAQETASSYASAAPSPAAMEINELAREAATSLDNDRAQPTAAQAVAGNYKKVKVPPRLVHGLPITIENPDGSVRIDKEGNWASAQKGHYGYIRRTKGKDGDQVDVNIGPQPEAETVFVVNQLDPATGKFDEHKVMVGYATRDEAEAAYRANFPADWQGFGGIEQTDPAGLKSWLSEGDANVPFSGTNVPNPGTREVNAAPQYSKTPKIPFEFNSDRNDGITREDPSAVPELDGKLNSVPMVVADREGGTVLSKQQREVITAAVNDLLTRGMPKALLDGVRSFYVRQGLTSAEYYIEVSSVGVTSDVLDAAAEGDKGSIAHLRGMIAHELAHHEDENPNGKPASVTSQDFALEDTGKTRVPRGKIMREAFIAWRKGGEFGRLMNYPLMQYKDHTSGNYNEAMGKRGYEPEDMTEMLQQEVYAQLRRLYFTNPTMLRVNAPSAYELFEEIASVTGNEGKIGAARAALQQALRRRGAAHERARAILGRAAGRDAGASAADGRADSGVGLRQPVRPASGAENADGLARAAVRAAESRAARNVESGSRLGDARVPAASQDGRPEGQAPRLTGLPAYSPGPNPVAQKAAREYMKQAGLPYSPPTDFVKVDPAYAKRVADAYEAMPHAPNDLRVKAAYREMIKETIAQWKAIEKTGLKVTFGDEKTYPYTIPQEVFADVRDNNHMWVFKTDGGFGSDASFDASKNPLLEDTGIVINGHKALANDIFRIVHDYFGHIKEGVGFRANGEENAWRVHSAMYSPLARKAMTSETRGQNSWVNWGPHGETNRNASQIDTKYADQKTGILPQEFVEVDGQRPAKLEVRQWDDERAPQGKLTADEEVMRRNLELENRAFLTSSNGRGGRPDLQSALRHSYNRARERSGMAPITDWSRRPDDSFQALSRKRPKKLEVRGDGTEYDIGVERGERETGAARITAEDFDKITSDGAKLKLKPAEVKDWIRRARETRARFPSSKGWAPLELVGLKSVTKPAADGTMLDIVDLVWKQQPYGFNAPPGSERAPVKMDTAWASKIAAESVKEIKALYERARNGDKVAANIVAHASWYRGMVARLREKFGGQADFFADLLGAMSPNTPVTTNWAFAIDAIQAFSRGEYRSELQMFSEWIDSGKSASSYPAVHKIRQLSGKLFGMNSGNGMMAMLNTWRNVAPGMAPKARNFAANLIGASDMATIDVWAARFLRRMADNVRGANFPRIPVPAEKGVSGKWDAKATKVTGEFGFGANVLKEVSSELKKAGIDLTPPDLQAVAWFVEKELWTKNAWTSQQGEGGSFEQQDDNADLRRYLAGMSIQKGDKAPSDPAMQAAAMRLMAVTAMNDDVVAARALPTTGMYFGSGERSFDAEVTAKAGWDSSEWVAEIARISKENGQLDAFVSRVVPMNEDNPNARPGIEVYFKKALTKDQLANVQSILDAAGEPGFTLTVDPRAGRTNEGQEPGSYTGLRIQYVPEIGLRFGDPEIVKAVKDGPEAIRAIMDTKAAALRRVAAQLATSEDVAYANAFLYDTVVFGQENYDEYTAGSSEEAAGGSRARVWFGAPVHEVLARAAERIERGPQAVDGDAVQRSSDGDAQAELGDAYEGDLEIAEEEDFDIPGFDDAPKRPRKLDLKTGVTETPEFREWFGDSKVVDENGKPRVVYHGTSKDVDFASFRIGGRGAWFTENPSTASEYARSNDSQDVVYEGGKYVDKNTASRVMPVYLSIQNPYPYAKLPEDQKQKLMTATNYAKAQKEVFSQLARQGYDGVDHGGGIWVAFEPTQIKSAVGNKGTFSRKRPSVLELNAGQVASNVQQRVADVLHTSKTFNFWHKTVGTQYHKAQVDSDFKPVFDGVQNYLNDASQFMREAADLAPDILPHLDGLSDMFKAGPNRKSLKQVSDAVFDGTLADTVYTDQQLRARGLGDKEISMYRQVRASIDRTLDQAFASEAVKQARNLLPQSVLDQAKEQNDGWIVVNALSSANRTPVIQQVYDNLRERMAKLMDMKRQGYAPLMRFGQYTVTVKDAQGEVVLFTMHERESAANAMARQARSDPQLAGHTVESGVLSQEAWKLFEGVSPDALELFADSLGPRGSNDVIQQYIKNATNNRSVLKRLMKRKKIEGFSDDVQRTLAQFVTSTSRATSRNYHWAGVLKAANDVPKEKGDVKDEAAKLVEYMNGTGEEAGALRGLLFVQFLGGSVASAATNATQPIMMTFPYLSRFGGAAKAAARLTAAARFGFGSTPTEPVLAAAMRKAAEQGITEPHEVAGLYAESIRNFGSNLFVRKALKSWGSLFSLAEAFNRKITFVAAFRTAQEEGMADPYQFAVNAIAETQGVYNRGNRPDWARGAVGATLFTFKQYSVSYMEFLKRLPPKQRALALAMLVLAAGVQGLPGMDDAEDVIDTIAESLGYNFNSKKALREWAIGVAGEDLGGFLAHGFSGLPGVPLDVQARLGLGNLLPGTSLLKRSQEDKGRDVLEFFGPAGSQAKSLVEAVSAAQDGDVGAIARSLVPVAGRNLLKGVDMAQTGWYRDDRGRRVTEASESDAFLKSLGFQPSTVARQDLQQTINLQRDVERDIAGAWARGIVDKDPEAVQRARAKLLEWNQTNPEARVLITPSQIQKRVKELLSTREQRFIKAAPPELRKMVNDQVKAA